MPRSSPTSIILLSLAAWLLATSARAQAPKPVETAPIRAEGIDGSLVIVGGGGMPDSIRRRFVELAGGEKARLVVIPTASGAAETDTAEEWLAPWKPFPMASAVVLHTRDRARADDPAFAAPLKEATAVWFSGGDQSRIAEAYLGTAVEREILGVLARGGVVGGTSAGAAIQTRLMITGGNPEATTGQGLDLLPGAVVDQHFLKRNRKPRLLGVLKANPGHVGFGVDEATALVVTGRELSVVGNSTVTVCLVEGGGRPAEETELKPGETADLTALRRAARDRTQPEFPPKEAAIPRVENGSLVIVGGGGMPRGLVERFLELAGGPDAPIVVVPTANPGPIPGDVSRVDGVGMLRKAGARNVAVLRGRTRAEIETPEQLALLKNAKGIWFGGGRQWRFVDCYEGTPVVELFHDVLRRGGVIGGSSAGATIQGDYLVRGNPLGNTDMMARGYERGFAFLPGTAIDQHFTQRNRFADLAAVVDRFPQLLGIGIDESTALVVRGGVAEVVGDHAAHFYDRRTPPQAGAADHATVPAGGRYDLVERRALADESAAAPPSNAPLKICLVSGSEEYKSDETLDALKAYLEANFPAKCTLIKAVGDRELPGTEALTDCDVALFFTRRLKIDGPALDAVKRYVLESNKPIVALRTASHGFQNWLAMDGVVFGGNYQGHFKNELTTEIQINPSAADHPILRGFHPFTSKGSLYKVLPLLADTTMLLSGTSPESTQPLAWTRTFQGKRVFYTSLGHPDDFDHESFRRLVANALFWAAQRDGHPSAKSGK